jgi:hypothetical protein
MDQNLFAMLEGLPDEQVLEMFYPYAQEQAVLDQEMALAERLRQPSEGQHVSAIGAALGGLSDAVGNVAGAYKQNKALEGQKALGAKMQKEAAGRVGGFAKQQQEAQRQQALEEFLRNRGNAMGFNTGITNWGG